MSKSVGHPIEQLEPSGRDLFGFSEGIWRNIERPDPATLRSAESFGEDVQAEMHVSSNDMAERIEQLLEFFDYSPDVSEQRVRYLSG